MKADKKVLNKRMLEDPVFRRDYAKSAVVEMLKKVETDTSEAKLNETSMTDAQGRRISYKRNGSKDRPKGKGEWKVVRSSATRAI